MMLRPDASSQDIAAARVELGEALAGERAATAAGQRNAASAGALVVLVLVLTCAFATTWIDEDGDISRAVWWVLFALLALALALLLSAAAAVASAGRPRRSPPGDLLEHIPALTESGDQRLAIKHLVAIADATQRLRVEIAQRLSAANVLLALAAGAVACQAVVLALGVQLNRSADSTSTTKTAADPIATKAATFAPVIQLHPAESSGPLDPAMLLRGAALRWRRPGPDKTIVPTGRIDAKQLGAACADPTCVAYGPFHAHALTRPFSDGTARPRRLPVSRGMYLEAPDLMRRGQLVRRLKVPAFFEATTSKAKPLEITYWLFFGASRPFARPPKPSREGDWERFTLRFDAKRKPKELVLRADEPPVAWKDVEQVNGHPKLYASLDTHALYTTTSRTRPGKSPRGHGLRWVITPTDLHNVRTQPWYGFGGAWGHAGGRGDLTGPPGPTANRPAT